MRTIDADHWCYSWQAKPCGCRVRLWSMGDEISRCTAHHEEELRRVASLAREAVNHGGLV